MSMRSKMFYSLLGQVIAPVFGLATAPLLAQGLGENGRGDLAAATAPLLLTTAIGVVGLPEAGQYFVARMRSQRRATVRQMTELLLLLGVVFSVVTWFLAVPLSAGNDHLRDLIRVTAIATVPSFLVIGPAAFAAGTQMWRFAAVRSALLGVLRLALVLGLLVVDQLTPMTALLVTTLSPIIVWLMAIPAIRRALAEPVGEPEPTRVTRRALLGYGSRIWVGSWSGIVLTRIDQLVMVPLAGARQLGLYAVAVTVAEIPVIVSSAMRSVIFSADSHEYDEDGARALEQRLQQTARIATLVAATVSAGVGLSAWWWLPPLFGEGFRDSVPLVLVLLLAAILGSGGSVAGAALSARNRPGLRSASMTIGAILNLAILLVLTPRIGAMGAAISTVAGSAVAGNLNIFWLNRRFGMPLRNFYGVRRADLEVIASAARVAADKVLRRGPS